MQKKLIALAVAGAMVAPAAMAEVTVSGGVQAEIVNVSGDGVVPEGTYLMDGLERSGQNSGSYSFLKFAATEDLGNGLNALASYNFTIAPDNILGTRDAYVGIKGGFGAVLAGRLSTPYKSSTAGWDPFLATSLQARGNNGMSTLHNGYVNNAVAYAGDFGGIKVVAAVVLDEAQDPDDAEQTHGSHPVSFSVNAPVGPVEVAVAYIDASEQVSCKTASTVDVAAVPATAVPVTTTTTCAEGADDVTATKVGLKWASDALTVAGQVEMLGEGLTPTGETGNVVWVGASFKMSEANTLSASFGQFDKDANDGDNEATYMAVGANHSFSKTTSAFVGYMASDSGESSDMNALSLGMRVNF